MDIIFGRFWDLFISFDNFIELLKIIVTPFFTFLTASFVAYLTYKFALKQIQRKKRLEFIERQIVDFYSPMLGMVYKIRSTAELWAERSKAEDAVWKKKCEKGFNNPREIEDEFEPFKKDTEYEIKQFHEKIIPLYDSLLETFTINFWLAEDSTKKNYKELYRFIEIWHRILEKSITYEVYSEIKIDEKRLFPFYENLENTLNLLKSELS